MKLGYDRDIWEKEHFKEPIRFDQNKLCSLLLSGSSGSGKSVSLLYSIYHLDPCNLYFFDFKGDFQELKNCEHYKSGDSVVEALELYHEAFQKSRKNEIIQEQQNILVIDEYPALIAYLNKKDSERIKVIIQSLLMLGRGVQKGWGTWIVTQRPDAALFTGGARINFMIIQHMGRSTPEDWRMNFSGIDKPDRDYKTGQGVVLADGCALRNLIVPHIDNMDKLTEGVRNHLNGIW